MKPRILFVDDDVDFVKAIEFALGEEFYIVTSSSYLEAERLIGQQAFDLIALDYDLGSHSSEGLLEKIAPDTPILIVTGKADKEMAIRLLNRRVHGLLEKPTSSKLLREKIHELTTSAADSNEEDIVTLSLKIIRDQRKILMGTETVILTPTEMKIFDMILKMKGRRIERDEICRNVWGNIATSKNTLDTHLTNLKRKIPVLNEKMKALYGAGIYLDV
jgi:DNA-binding response OmpR family regulator